MPLASGRGKSFSIGKKKTAKWLVSREGGGWEKEGKGKKNRTVDGASRKRA